MNKERLLFILLLLFLAFTGCEDKTDNKPASEIEDGSWVIYSTLKWTHDGYPITGTLFKVYSDGASYALKQQCLEFAERVFEDVLNVFYDDRDGSSFGDAFENNFGLSLEVFEDEYYDRIKAYLTAMNKQTYK